MKHRDPLYVNRVLKITGVPVEKKENQGLKAPVSEGKNVPAEKAVRVIYRVKKGDTLAAIAKRYGTTVRVLAKLNRLKLSDPLYVDKKLVISGNPAL
jgi:LysM repeat protein